MLEISLSRYRIFGSLRHQKIGPKRQISRFFDFRKEFEHFFTSVWVQTHTHTPLSTISKISQRNDEKRCFGKSKKQSTQLLAKKVLVQELSSDVGFPHLLPYARKRKRFHSFLRRFSVNINTFKLRFSVQIRKSLHRYFKVFSGGSLPLPLRPEGVGQTTTPTPGKKFSCLSLKELSGNSEFLLSRVKFCCRFGNFDQFCAHFTLNG